VPEINNQLLDTIALERELGSRSLHDFIRMAWHVLEPDRTEKGSKTRTSTFKDNWHIDVICDHLEAVTSGEIQKIVINIPPRHMKSLLCAVFWPAWEWTTQPEKRFLFSSYSGNLSTRDSRKCRNLIKSPWYQERWGHVFQLDADQDTKMAFENNARGHRIATSVGGVVTGQGGDRIVVDDAHNVLEAESDAARTAALTWWDEAMSTRANDPSTAAFVIIGQRVHARDLSGHVLAKEDEDYYHLMIPVEFEPERAFVTPWGVDPREEDGELLWPGQYPEPVVKSLKNTMGSYASAGQLQQRPAPREGGMIKVDMLKVTDHLPGKIIKVVRAWDNAATEAGGANTAGVKLALLDSGEYIILHVTKGQWSTERRYRMQKLTSQLDGVNTGIWLEQEPGSSGKDTAKASVKNLAGYAVRVERPTGDKVHRAEPFSAQVEAGFFWMMQGSWNADYIDEARDFPGSVRKDQIDATSLAFNKIATAAAGWGDFYGDGVLYENEEALVA
jgi:predicted phage terminase large subunit-like protein